MLQPDLMQEIHRQYIRADAMIIKTNTFGANCINFKKIKLNSKVKEINAAGVEIAKKEVSYDGYIAGSIGPVFTSTKEDAECGQSDLVKIGTEQASVLIEEGVDIILLETFASAEYLVNIIKQGLE